MNRHLIILYVLLGVGIALICAGVTFILIR